MPGRLFYCPLDHFLGVPPLSKRRTHVGNLSLQGVRLSPLALFAGEMLEQKGAYAMAQSFTQKPITVTGPLNLLLKQSRMRFLHFAINQLGTFLLSPYFFLFGRAPLKQKADTCWQPFASGGQAFATRSFCRGNVGAKRSSSKGSILHAEAHH